MHRRSTQELKELKRGEPKREVSNRSAAQGTCVTTTGAEIKDLPTQLGAASDVGSREWRQEG